MSNNDLLVAHTTYLSYWSWWAQRDKEMKSSLNTYEDSSCLCTVSNLRYVELYTAYSANTLLKWQPPTTFLQQLCNLFWQMSLQPQSEWNKTGIHWQRQKLLDTAHIQIAGVAVTFPCLTFYTHVYTSCCVTCHAPPPWAMRLMKPSCTTSCAKMVPLAKLFIKQFPNKCTPSQVISPDKVVARNHPETLKKIYISYSFYWIFLEPRLSGT